MTLPRELADVPEKPGVYLMKSARDEVLYVGKAINLKARLRSYVTPGSDTREFINHLDRLVASVETILTTNEKEALLLEQQLVKQLQPRFNIKLKDDKNFLKLRIDRSHPFPRVEPVRRFKKDGADYFGPYHSASSVRNTLHTLNRFFQLRTCTDSEFKNRSRPCLQHQIKRCPGPCVLPVDPAEYTRTVENAMLFLEGKTEVLVERLKTQMRTAADAWNFEYASTLRDQIGAIQKSLDSQTVVPPTARAIDCIGFYREGSAVEIQLLCFRDRQLTQSESFGYKDQQFPSDEVLGSFLAQLYGEREELPQDLLLPLAVADQPLLEQWLRERAGRRVQIVTPSRGDRRRLVELASLNAAQNLKDQQQTESRLNAILEELQQRLQLRRKPIIIECYDNSNLQGREPVASKVCFVEGRPERRAYRHFKHELPEVPNDFLMMAEVLRRRLTRGLREGDLPDLIIVDGGKGQLSAGLAALEALGLGERIDLIALAKARSGGHLRRRKGLTVADDDPEGSPERVFRVGDAEPVVFDAHSDALFLLQRLRDESHRFALSFHRKQRKLRALTSPLDGIPGVGKKRRLALLWHFGSLRRVKAASQEQLAGCPGINSHLAAAIFDHFRQNGRGDR